MPELPEVEAVCRRLTAEALGARITAAHFPRPAVARPQTAASVSRLASGRVIEAVRRRGKNIFVDLTGGSTIHVHLRMTGNLYVIADSRFRPAMTRVWFEFEDGRALIFEDPRALGRVHAHKTGAVEKLLEAIGVEPLHPAFTPAVLAALTKGSKQPIKQFLLDQRHIAGIGNIYAAEALFEARIDPTRLAGSLSRARITRLHAAIVGVLERAVQSACTAYRQPGRFEEAESFPLQVYDREGQRCGTCRRIIQRIPQGGRSTYYCPGCQK